MKNILIVDDDLDVSECVKIHCESLGHIPLVVNDMASTVTALTSGVLFDVILLDLQGGDIDRVAVAETGRRLGVRVITMSGAYELKPVLEKPFGKNDLKQVLQQI